MSDPNPPPPLRVRRPIWNVFWPVSLAATVFFASSQSRLATPVEFNHMDKVVHTLTFGLLATLAVRIIFHRRHPVRSALAAVVCVSIFGMTDEFHQSFTPGRSVDVADWVADTGGAMLAVVLYTMWPRYRAILEFRPFTRRSSPSGVAPDAAPADASSAR